MLFRSIAPGIVGLLGPNGAGKTTLLRLLIGLVEPTRGRIRFRGARVLPENRAGFRRHVGFLPQEFNAYPGFTGEEFLDYWALERGMSSGRERGQEIARLLEWVGLVEHRRRRVRDYSGGMRQRLGVARALLGTPPILVVDEPTTGLDIESRQRFREILLATAGERIVLLSTHLASDVDAVASRVLVLHGGRLRFDGTPQDLVARAEGRVFSAVVSPKEVPALSARYRVTTLVRVLAGVRLRAVAPPGAPLAGAPVAPTLEEAYLAEVMALEAPRADRPPG